MTVSHKTGSLAVMVTYVSSAVSLFVCFHAALQSAYRSQSAPREAAAVARHILRNHTSRAAAPPSSPASPGPRRRAVSAPRTAVIREGPPAYERLYSLAVAKVGDQTLGHLGSLQCCSCMHFHTYISINVMRPERGVQTDCPALASVRNCMPSLYMAS